MAFAGDPTPPRGVRNPTFPLPVFPDSHEWWNPDDWREAAAIAASITDDTSFQGVRIPTGTKFWLRAMASFPALQLVVLTQVRGFYKRKGGRQIAEPVPGLGWEIYLQRFSVADPEAIGGAFAAASREEEDSLLVKARYICNQQGCTEYVCVCVCLFVVEMVVCLLACVASIIFPD